ncbi:hypothetical protein KAX06_08905 [candidate division WOR-3 bacterium]|nr:hypothetical protein [candidate division WOR-3 bacterium]
MGGRTISRPLLATSARPILLFCSSGLSATRHKKAGQKLVKSWSKDGQKMDKNGAILGYF